MFFWPTGLHSIQKVTLELWIEQTNSYAHFDIHKRSPNRSPKSSQTKIYTQKWSKIRNESFSFKQKLLIGGSGLGSGFKIFEKYEISAFTGKKINVIAILENFLVSRESRCYEKLLWASSRANLGIAKFEVPHHFFWKFWLRHFIFR